MQQHSLVVESRAEIPDEVTGLKEITNVAIGNLIWYYLDMGYLHMHGFFFITRRIIIVEMLIYLFSFHIGGFTQDVKRTPEYQH